MSGGPSFALALLRQRKLKNGAKGGFGVFVGAGLAPPVATPRVAGQRLRWGWAKKELLGAPLRQSAGREGVEIPLKLVPLFLLFRHGKMGQMLVENPVDLLDCFFKRPFPHGHLLSETTIYALPVGPLFRCHSRYYMLQYRYTA